MNCPVCGASFPGDAILDRHLAIEHPDTAAEIARAHEESVKRERAERAEQERVERAIPVHPHEREEPPEGSAPRSNSTLDLLDRLTGDL